MVTATWTADGTPQIDITWTGDAAASSYDVQIRRNGQPQSWFTKSTVQDDGSSSYSETFHRGTGSNPNRAARIDGYYEIRVLTDSGTSLGTDDLFSPPTQPANPAISRPDANTITVEWTMESEFSAAGYGSLFVDVQVAEVASDGTAGAWQYARRGYQADISGDVATMDARLSIDLEVGTDYGEQIVLSEESVYRVRLRHGVFDEDGRRDSEWVYADYGTQDSHIEQSGFESGGLNAWSDQSTIAGDSGVISGEPPRAQAHLPSGAANGTFYFYGNEASILRKWIGDLSGKTGEYVIRMRAAVATQVETVTVEWLYNGSWSQIYEFGGEYNATGWHTHHIPVPPEQLGTANEIRIRCGANSWDFCLIDKFMFADVTEERTAPIAATNLSGSADADSLDLAWNTISGFADHLDFRYRPEGGTWNVISSIGTGSTSYSHSMSVSSGEIYDLSVLSRVAQYRRGSFGQWLLASSSNVTVGYLEPPSNIVIVSVDGDDITIGWTPANAGETEQRVYRSRDGGEAYSRVATLGTGVSEYEDANLLDGERYTYTVAAANEVTVSREDDGSGSDPGGGSGTESDAVTLGGASLGLSSLGGS